MPLTLPYTINPGDDLDATQVQGNLQTLADAFPVTDANQSAIAASKVSIPSGFQWPSSTIPSQVIPAVTSYLDSDPLYVNTLNTQHVVRNGNNAWGNTSAPGWISPIKDGFIVPYGSGSDNLKEYYRNSSSGQDDIYMNPRTYTLSSGDVPVHCVAASGSSIVYVSCSGTQKIKKITLGNTASATTVKDLSGTYSSLGRIFIDRYGKYLFVVCKVSGDTNMRRLCRVEIATGTVSESSMADDYDIVDAKVHYTGPIANNMSGTSAEYVLIAQKTTGGSTGLGKLFRVTNSAFSGTITTLYTAGSNESIYAMTGWRGKVALWTHDTTATEKTYCRIYGWDEYTDTSEAYDVVYGYATASSTIKPLQGAAATDGRLCYCLSSDGRMYVYDPSVSSSVNDTVSKQKVRPGFTGLSGGDVVSYSGLCFNGKTLIGCFKKSSDSKGYIFAY